MLGFAIAGPVLLAISAVLFFAAFDSVASSVIDNAPPGTAEANDYAKNALTGETTYSIFAALQLAGLLTTVIAMIYTSLWAMRVGLLTRLLGLIGIGLGAGFSDQGPAIAIAIWTLLVSPLIARFWPGPRPPAWDAGEAIEWPAQNRGGKAPPAKKEEKRADPKDFGGDEDEGDGDGEDEESGAEQTPSRPSRRDNRRKRKRKQRG